MGLSFLNGVSRRNFIKIAGSVSAVFAFASPFRLLAGTGGDFKPVIRNDLDAAANSIGSTGMSLDLVNFSQVSDVHITDITCPLRLENLKWLGVKEIDLEKLDVAIDSLKRDQSNLSCQIWNAVIRSINDYNKQNSLDFMICTGDHTDTDTEKELSLFIEIADGVKSATFRDMVATGGIKNDFIPEGLNIPWYATIGNHDVAYVGSFNSRGLLFNILIPLFGGRKYLEELSSKNETIGLYKISDSDPGPKWHGFANQPDQPFMDWQGYYSFTPKPYIHCIVLNTANFNDYDPEKTGEMPKETFSLGVLDRSQYEWMVSEIKDNSDKLCLVFSHHSPVSNRETDTNTSFMDIMSDIKASELRETLCSYPNVIAHINGHSHINQINPVKSDNGGYWNINTCALIEWPMEWRNIRIRDNGDGTGSIISRMIKHDDSECLDVAKDDPAANCEYREGCSEDRDAELVFTMPEAVSRTIIKNRPEADDEQNPEDRGTSDSMEGSGNSSDDSRCFIATAAFGTVMAPEVVTLRKFRDDVLMPNAAGRLFVRAYYRMSPRAARFISGRPLARRTVRMFLKSVISIVRRRHL